MNDIEIVGEKEIDNNTIEKEMSGITEMMTIPGMFGKTLLSLPRSSFKIASPNMVRKWDCLLPPYNPAEILRYKALDITFQSCIEIKADTVVGLGYTFGYKDIDNRPDIIEFFKKPNRNFNDTITLMLKNMFIDLELFHNGYLEFVKSGDKRSLYYMPSKDIYIRPKKDAAGNILREVDKYLYIPSDNITPIEFEPYPITKKVRDGVHYIIHFKKPSQDDTFYGKPDTSHLFDLIKQNYLSDQYNINFFSNGGQPAWAILITGGKLSTKSYEKIKDFIDNNLKGVANSHKMLFLSVPNEKATIKLIPLSKTIDQQFITLSDNIQFKIALKCRVHPKLLGLNVSTGLGGGSAGITDLKLFIETVAQPTQNEIIELFNKFLELEFGVNCEFSLKSMDISNEKDDAVIANLYWNMVDEAGNRAIGINEIRQIFLHLKPINLIETKENETQTEELGNLEITPTKEGEMRTNDNNSLDIGDGEEPSNFNPDKFNKEKI